MIWRVLRSLQRRIRARTERLRQRIVAAPAERALALLPPAADQGPVDPSREILLRLARLLSLDHLTRFTLQADSPPGYDALALRASRGRLTAVELARLGQLLEGPSSAGIRADFARFDFPALVSLARAMQQHAHPDTSSVLDAALAVQRRSQRGDSLVLAQLLLLEGRDRDADRVLASLGSLGWEGERLLGDVTNPFSGIRPGPVSEWTALAARIYRGSSVEPFTIATRDEAAVPFDLLSAPVVAGSVPGGPLISVIMSAYRPGKDALVSARSILAQSWRNLELLVMDDASGPDFDPVFAEIGALDDRVRVVRAEENGGTYRRRNDALLLARGEFVTMQDSDDWSHPRRLELQARHLQENPKLPANLTVALRVTDDLRFVQRRGLHLRLCEPAIMFHRAAVVDRIGVFDPVRKSGDSEFRVRIAQTWGDDPPVIWPRTPLMLMRSDSASLSGSDFGDGWTAPTRFAYRSAYLHWQAEELRNRRVPKMAATGPRPFPAPTRIEGRSAAPAHWPIVVAGDARRTTMLDATDRILAALDEFDGGGAAFLHLPSFRSPQAMLTAGRLQHRINEGSLGELSLDEEAEVELLVLAHHDAALGLPRRPVGIRPRRVVVIVDAGAARPDGRGYAAELVDAAVARAFGVVPEWRASARS